MADPQTLNETLQSQIGEQDGAREKLLRLCRQNKLAVVSAVVILLILLMAVFAPLIAPYGEAEQDALNRLQPPSASCPASSRWPSASWPGCWPGISAAGWTISSCASRM